MINIAIGSKNPAKYEAVIQALNELEIFYTWESFEVDSGVSAQPLSDQETINGAIQRAKGALLKSGGDFAIGLEGGIVIGDSPQIMVCNWGGLVDRTGKEFIAGGARIALPDYFKEAVLAGKELGDLMDEYCQSKDIRKHEGAIGIFTNGAVTRLEMFKHVSKMLIGQWQYAQK
ncbi:DUF84 family protein [Sutcliffiella halmapala]|uniref:DUF84 family protein n=1 Tax=Sutcliffiella halmapala TaxID=79882 RepID=UPI002E26B5D9